MTEEGLQDNERLHQLSPELFLVLEASKTKAAGWGWGWWKKEVFILELYGKQEECPLAEMPSSPAG